MPQEKKQNGTAKKNKMSVWNITAVVLVLLVVCAAVFLLSLSLKITVPEEQPVIAEAGTEAPAVGVSAVVHDLFIPGGFEVGLQSDMTDYQSRTIGIYEITYFAEFLWMTDSETVMVSVEDTTPPTIALNEDPEHFTSPNAEYEEEGYAAYDACDGDVTDQVKRTDNGDGTVDYTVTDSAGNRAVVTRTIRYDDQTAPVITLAGGEQVTMESGAEFVEPGYSASDDVDGDITDQVQVKITDNQVIYSVDDSYGNHAEASRTIVYQDTEPPALTLSGDTEISINAGRDYAEPGYQAYDAVDGDMTGAVTVSGEVNRYHAGDYTLTYSVTDSSGNTSTVDRIIHVLPVRQQSTPESGSKIVYLTFDDGPGAYTQQLLDMLAQYNVKVTFFVTNQYPAYQYLIGTAAAAGHSIGIHSYSHVYNSIYASEDAFFDDLNKMQSVIVQQTGSETRLLRFPGGSSNTISNITPGIMTALTQDVLDMGYQYFDWNVLSGDAGETTDTDTIAQNIISGIQQHNTSIVLQHDVKSYSVAAVEQVIIWGIENGYTFLPLTTSSPGMHHTISN